MFPARRSPHSSRLRSANTALLEGHVNCCVKDAAKKGGKALDEKMEELIRVVKIAQTK